jgi:hypothetical protein
MGTSLDQLAPHNVDLIDEGDGLRVQLLNIGMAMPERFGSPLDLDAPICWLSGEFIRFGRCQALGNNIYRLSRLQRGCPGSTSIAQTHPAGQMFVQIEADTARLIELSNIMRGDTIILEASGLADTMPANASATAQLLATTPLAPVGGSAVVGLDDMVTLRWIRRSRIDLGWRDGVDQVMVEGSEQYVVMLLANGEAIKEYITSQPGIEINGTEWMSLAIPANAVVTAEVRQIGKHRQSPPLSIPIS